MSVFLGCLLSYALGAIPVALVIVRAIKGVDVRTIGSGNVGATNASRAFGKGARIPMFLAVYLLDFAKGFAPAFWFPDLFTGEPAFRGILFGTCAIVGHCASPVLKFKGGKGVATTTGVVAAVDPLALGVSLLAFFAVLGATRQVFWGSLAIGVALAATVILRDVDTAFDARLPQTVFACSVALFLVYTHRSNLKKVFGS